MEVSSPEKKKTAVGGERGHHSPIVEFSGEKERGEEYGGKGKNRATWQRNGGVIWSGSEKKKTISFTPLRCTDEKRGEKKKGGNEERKKRSSVFIFTSRWRKRKSAHYLQKKDPSFTTFYHQKKEDHLCGEGGQP